MTLLNQINTHIKSKIEGGQRQVITSHSSNRKEVQAQIEQSLRVFKLHDSIWRERRDLRFGSIRLESSAVFCIVQSYIEEPSRIARRIDVKFSDIINSAIEAIWYIPKRHWQWLGNILRMTSDRTIEPPQRALEHAISSSLLAHLH